MDKEIVKTKLGILRGKSGVTTNGTPFCSFSGIPYAKPPIRELRFKDPVPFGAWSGVRDATEEGSKSSQYDHFNFTLSGEDDSLFLNIHAPKSAVSSPVMIQIHGGGFVSGTGNVERFGPEFLIDKGIVYASMNYRLGVMGFLCTDPNNARGDMGLKDQNMALRWIKDNIEDFGGDSDNITIFGVSAGAASVEYHLLSPLSRGLFNKAIMQSGSAFNPWARIRDPLKQSRNLAKRLGYTSNDDDGLFNFINGFETMKIVEASIGLLDDDDLKEGLYMAFVPVVNVFKDNKGFLNEEPIDIMRNKSFCDVPTISGICDKEGIFIYFFYNQNNAMKDFDDSKFIDYIPHYLNKNFTGGNERMKEIYSKTSHDRNSDENLIDLFSDISINGGAFFSLDERVKYSKENHYFYHFVHEGNLTMYKFKGRDGTHMQGCSHADDIGYLATRKAIVGDPTPEDVIVRNQMVDMWSNFGKIGNPTPNEAKIKWPCVVKEDFVCLELNPYFRTKKQLMEKRKTLWQEIYNNQ